MPGKTTSVNLAIRHDPDQIKNLLLVLEHARADAWLRRDIRALEALLAPDSLEINYFGRFSRDDLLLQFFPRMVLQTFTIEDPVEYQFKGIGQIHVNPKIGLTFASGLRSILRQDPDIIMVGEIRDYETAEIAIQASLTGHLVLSTLHTIDAPSAVIRLVDMGVEPFLVASSLSAVLAQRLVRTLCPSCREAYEATPAERQYLSSPTATLYRGRGCEKCNETGYLGRIGIFELLVVDSDVRQMIAERVSAQDIKNVAAGKGVKTLFEDGLQKALQGVTSLQEVLRVTQKDYADISL